MPGLTDVGYWPDNVQAIACSETTQRAKNGLLHRSSLRAYSITSSASESRSAGMLMPNVATVRVMRGQESVGGTSIMGLMMLGAATGTNITVEATGSEAAAVVDALSRLVASGFGEED
jgi:phosphotransferase system HPr (HPr) family protein